MKINPIMVGTGAGLACVVWTIVALMARDYSEPNRELFTEMAYSYAGEAQREYVDDDGQPILSDGLVEQPLPEGTIYRGQRTFPFHWTDPKADTDAGTKNASEADRADREWTLDKALELWGMEADAVDEAAWVARGKQLYDWNCQHCHGMKADGRSVINLGPANNQIKSLVDPELDAMKRNDGWIFYVITNGSGVMRPHADKVQDPLDRWKIIMYLRELQGK